MGQFAWEAKTKSGQSLKGEMEASSKEAVISTLEGRDLVPGKIKERGKGMDMEINIPGFEAGVSGKDLAVFTRQFSTMIDAGLPLVQCLDILAKDSAIPPLKKALFAVKEEVESGATFADALGKHPKIFDELYVNLVAAGEIGGILDTILTRLAEYIEKAEKLKKQVKGAMVYPIVFLSIAFVIVAILMLKVIPVFAEMFNNMGGELPAFTQMVVNWSDWFKGNWYMMIAGFIAFVVIYRLIAIKCKRLFC